MTDRKHDFPSKDVEELRWMLAKMTRAPWEFVADGKTARVVCPEVTFDLEWPDELIGRFAVAARNALPGLLERLEELEEALREIQQRAQDHSGWWSYERARQALTRSTGDE